MPDTHRWDYIISPFSNVRDYDVATESLARLPPETPERFERAAQLMSRISGDTITCIAAELFEEKVADPTTFLPGTFVVQHTYIMHPSVL